MLTLALGYCWVHNGCMSSLADEFDRIATAPRADRSLWAAILSLTNRQSKKQRLANISVNNAKLVEDIVAITRKLVADGQKDSADTMIKIAEELLSNNKELQTVVSTISPDE
jgi:vacuolar-type H+-ATPase catalytic subunit A/Vma1